jgi:hypothetical protein
LSIFVSRNFLPIASFLSVDDKARHLVELFGVEECGIDSVSVGGGVYFVVDGVGAVRNFIGAGVEVRRV